MTETAELLRERERESQCSPSEITYQKPMVNADAKCSVNI